MLQSFLLLLLLLSFVTAELRLRRQSFYVCGTYPNQYYSYTPCYNNIGTVCPNGGSYLNVGCVYDFQCTIYAANAVCVGGCCCTSPTFYNPPPPTTTSSPLNSVLGYCPDGSRSRLRCTSSSSCAQGRSCMSGLCCVTTGNEWQTACAGQGALASCSNGGCGAFQCTTSNYCCECAFGRSSGLCNPSCPSGYSCSTNGYCCAQCTSGSPVGQCFSGQCPVGYSCNVGNICCPL